MKHTQRCLKNAEAGVRRLGSQFKNSFRCRNRREGVLTKSSRHQKVGRVTPCAPSLQQGYTEFCDLDSGCGAHGVMRPTLRFSESLAPLDTLFGPASKPRHPGSRGKNLQRTAFTLLELLVVIAVIAILASLIIPVAGAVKKKRMISVAQAELNEVQTAIEAYKAKLGYYPPDQPGSPAVNQLYFELSGTVQTNIQNRRWYVTLDGSARMQPKTILKVFGVQGFSNSSASAKNTDEGSAAVNFLKSGLKPNQIGQLVTQDGQINAILVCSIPWDSPFPSTAPITGALAPATPPVLNPWHYISTNPTNNTTSYDLWVDLYLGGRTNRISNWSKNPQVY